MKKIIIIKSTNKESFDLFIATLKEVAKDMDIQVIDG